MNNSIKYLTLSLSIVFTILVVAPFATAFAIMPKDNFDSNIKEYYIFKSFSFFDENDDESISLEMLIQRGYASRDELLSKEICDTNNSTIYKDGNIYTIDVVCKNYTSTLKILRGF